MGLVNRVVPVAELDALAEEWGRRLAAGPTLALGLSKRLLDASSSVTLEQALEDEARCQHITYTSEEHVREDSSPIWSVESRASAGAERMTPPTEA